MTPAQREAILAEVRGGNKIAAIKLCREATGLGLAEAKDWVEKLEGSPDTPLPTGGEIEGALSPFADLLFTGQRIAAIKLYREKVNPQASLVEAKEAVERLEAGLRAKHPEKFSASIPTLSGGGCALVFGLVLLMVFIVVIYLRK